MAVSGLDSIGESSAAAQTAARVSLGYNFAQTLLKLVAAALTGSVSLLSEALHAIGDLVASAISFVSVRAALQPADEEHPYGHGKIDTLAGLVEAVMLMGFAAFVAIQSIQRLFQPVEVQGLDWGILLMVVTGIGCLLTARYVGEVAKKTNSFALRSNHQHLMVDFWTNIGVIVALAVSKLTGWKYADPVFALVINGWLAYGAIRLGKKAFNEMIDTSIEPEELAEVKRIVANETAIHGYHDLRSRHSGAMHYVDFHIVVPREWSVVEAHDVADRIESQIEQALAPCVCTIHVDPYDPEKPRPASPMTPTQAKLLD